MANISDFLLNRTLYTDVDAPKSAHRPIALEYTTSALHACLVTSDQPKFAHRKCSLGTSSPPYDRAQRLRTKTCCSVVSGYQLESIDLFFYTGSMRNKAVSSVNNASMFDYLNTDNTGSIASAPTQERCKPPSREDGKSHLYCPGRKGRGRV